MQYMLFYSIDINSIQYLLFIVIVIIQTDKYPWMFNKCNWTTSVANAIVAIMAESQVAAK